MLILITSSIFIAVSLMTAILLYPLATREAAIHERLAKIAPAKREHAHLMPKKTRLQDWLTRVGQKLPLQTKELFTYRKLFAAAGFKKEAIYIWAGCRILLMLALPGLYLIFYALPSGIFPHGLTLLHSATFAVTGFLLPGMWLRRKAKQRRTIISNTLPDILDLLTICVESGLGIDAALVKACDNSMFHGNPLMEEMKVAVGETKAGKPRTEALKDMAERTMVKDVGSFVTMLIQTERFGTSLSQAMRAHADFLRTKRRQMAEEAAAKTTVKLLFPLVLLIFPALLIVIIGPAMFKITVLLK